MAKNNMKTIIEIFGKPSYPTILDNGELILNDKKRIPIGTVYLLLRERGGSRIPRPSGRG
jgi:hypothetical protein